MRRPRRYLRDVQKLTKRLPGPLVLLRLVLVGFVLAWIVGPYTLRAAVPIWLVFLIAVAVEVQFFVSGLSGVSTRHPDRGPLAVDRERYGYSDETDHLLLVHEGDERLWIPHSGESGEELEALIAKARADGDDFTAPAVIAREGPRPWQPVRRFLAGLAILGTLALIFWVVQSRTGWDALTADSRAEATARFSEEASYVAAKPVTIECDESGDHVGVVQHADGAAPVGGNVAYLTPERCLDLYRLAFKGEVTSSQTARAIAVLAHEAWHLRGVGDEGTTECYALQSGVALGGRLGLSEGTARQMMRQQLVENRGRGLSSLEYLVPPDCQDGGRLDLNPDVARFP